MPMYEVALCPSTKMAVSTGHAGRHAGVPGGSFVCPLCRDRHYPVSGGSWLESLPRAANADPLSEAC